MDFTNEDWLRARGWQVSHQTIRLFLLLLPVWVFGAGDLIRFASLNTMPGSLERNGLLKGRDFLQFYVAGTLAHDGQWNALYDVAHLREEVARIVPAAAGTIPAPVYGPQVALLFAPFARLTYLEARWIWLTLSAVLYLIAAALVVRMAAPLRAYRGLACMTIVCNPAFIMLLATGQTGAIGVLAWALGAAALARGRRFLLGMCLGLLAYKPPLLIGALAALIVAGQWRVLNGALVSIAGQSLTAILVTGVEPWRLYLQSLASVSQYYFLTDTLPHQKQSLSGFFQLLVGPGATVAVLTALTGAGVLTLWWIRRRHRPTLEFLPMLTATAVLLSPHFYVYDLVLLTPSLLIVGERLTRGCGTQSERMVAWCSYALLYAPFSGAIAQKSHIQLSTIALVAFVASVHRLGTPSRQPPVEA